MKFLSLGCGVQSSAMFMMSCLGDLPRVDAAIFADTGDEPAEVYAYLEILKGLSLAHNIPLHIVSHGVLSQDYANFIEGRSTRVASIPLFTKRPDGKEGRLWRQCTNDYKVMEVRRQIRSILGGTRGGPHELWLGISTDEIVRIKPSRVKYLKNVYPLVDKGLSRADCLEWIEGHGYGRPPRSACVYCPFRSNAGWKQLKLESPESFERAVAFDAFIRRIPKVNQECYVHRSLTPLGEIDFDNESPDLFAEECEGYCGL